MKAARIKKPSEVVSESQCVRSTTHIITLNVSKHESLD